MEILEKIDKEIQVFTLESEILLRLHLRLINENLIDTSYEELFIPINRTPYFHILTSTAVVIKNENLSRFIEIVLEEQEMGKIRLYKLEKEGYFRPFIITEAKDLLFSTTFFAQKLKKAEDFVEDKDITDYNFLETLKITERKENKVKGYYQAIGHMKNSEFIVNRDTGTFEVESKKKSEAYMVKVKATNIRDVIKYYETPYDQLFGFSKDGITNFEQIEYYEPYEENYFIHYAENVDIVEIYEKDEQGHLNPYSVKRVSKKNSKMKKAIEDREYKRRLALEVNE